MRSINNNTTLKNSYAILDLDHTLINTEISDFPNPILEKYCDYRFKLQKSIYYVFKRPGVDQFLDTLIKNFKGVAVWTAAMACYAKQIIKGLFGLEKASKIFLIWTRMQTQNDHGGLYKALSRIWQDQHYGQFLNPKNTVHIDNTASVMRYNPEQALIVPDFFYYKVTNKPKKGDIPIVGVPELHKYRGKVYFNNTDNYLFFLNELLLNLVKKKQTELQTFIKQGNLLTKWYENTKN
jgi:hypothetical protein